MSRHHSLEWGLAVAIVISLLSGCGGVPSTPVPVSVITVPTPIPPNPPVVQVRPAIVTRIIPTEVVPTTTPDGTLTAQPTLTLPPPVDRPFLMKISTISVVVGRGILLQGRVINGTLRANVGVEVLGRGKDILHPSLIAILISNRVQDHVTVGDYAGILVGGIEMTDLSPGMLLVEANQFKAYEEALHQLK